MDRCEIAPLARSGCGNQAAPNLLIDVIVREVGCSAVLRQASNGGLQGKPVPLTIDVQVGCLVG
jgi:hypothetical protein